MSAGRFQRGVSAFTLAELLVVLAIIGVLLALTASAVVRVMEGAHRIACENNLRQIGLALHQHHAELGVLPSNGGWDGKQQIPTASGGTTPVYTHVSGLPAPFYWGVGEPGRSPYDQTGSWAYAILPFVEQTSLHRERVWMTAVRTYHCPSRRTADAWESPDDGYGRYGTGGWKWARTDYAGNALVIPNRPRCLRLADLRDGTSSTILVGEKAMDANNYYTTWYWDEGFFVGGSGGTQRERPLLAQDAEGMGRKFEFSWGAPHPAGVHFVFGDGSVRCLSFDISQDVLKALLTPSGREAIDGL